LEGAFNGLDTPARLLPRSFLDPIEALDVFDFQIPLPNFFLGFVGAPASDELGSNMESSDLLDIWEIENVADARATLGTRDALLTAPWLSNHRPRCCNQE
jgi:hypothetical protein